MKKSLFASAILAAAMSSCTTTPQKQIPSALLEGEWNIASVAADTTEINFDQEDINIDPFVNIQVKEQQVYGNAGCNNFRGQINIDTLNTGAVKFGPLASTRMMCPSMKMEDMILKNIEQIVKFQPTNEQADTLQFLNMDDKVVMTLTKRAPYSLLAGKWTIAEIKGKAVETKEGEEAPFMEFEVAEAAKKLFCNAGCNSISGVFSLGADLSVSFNNIGMTEMHCKNMDTEDALVKAMPEIKTLAFTKEGISFSNEAKEVVLKLRK